MVADGRSLNENAVYALANILSPLDVGDRGMEGRSGKKGQRTFPADHLVAVVLGRQGLKGGFDDAAAETEDEVEG